MALLVIVGLTLAACGSDDGSAVTGDGPTTAQLAGRAFVSGEVTGHDLVQGSAITMRFADDSVSVHAGCNTMSGSYGVADGTFVADQFAMTEMACDEALMAQDTWLGEFLSSSPAITVDGSALRLSGDGVVVVLDEIEPTALVGTRWMVTSTVVGEGASSVPADSSASITIAADGTVDVDTGCNTGTGSVEVGEDTVTFGSIATTERACPPEQMALEASVLSVLRAGGVTYEIDGASMSLRAGDGADQIGLDLSAT